MICEGPALSLYQYPLAYICVYASCAVQMWFNIIGQSVFQLTVLLTIVFHGDVLFDVPSARGNTHGEPPTEHYTIVFTMFVMMQARLVTA